MDFLRGYQPLSVHRRLNHPLGVAKEDMLPCTAYFYLVAQGFSVHHELNVVFTSPQTSITCLLVSAYADPVYFSAASRIALKSFPRADCVSVRSLAKAFRVSDP